MSAILAYAIKNPLTTALALLCLALAIVAGVQRFVVVPAAHLQASEAKKERDAATHALELSEAARIVAESDRDALQAKIGEQNARILGLQTQADAAKLRADAAARTALAKPASVPKSSAAADLNTWLAAIAAGGAQ